MSSKPVDEFADALALATRYTRSRVRSVHEVRAYLQQHGLTARLTARVIAAGVSRGLLDDQAAAALWVEHWARHGYAWAAIRAKLAAKGFDERVVAEAGRGSGVMQTDEARARAVVQRAATRTTSANRLRVARRLAGRGFDQDIIERILEDVTAS